MTEYILFFLSYYSIFSLTRFLPKQKPLVLLDAVKNMANERLTR